MTYLKSFFDGIVAIVNSRRRKKYVGELRKTLNNKHWQKELATLKISLPRRQGNSTLAIMLLEKFSKKAILVTGFKAAAQAITKQLKPKQLHLSRSIYTVLGLHADPREEIIIIDGLSSSNYDLVYESCQHAKFFIFIG
ncbi:MAG: hypothetical protein Q7R33_02815 [Nitrosarchaeum sp.]|nr:hypothetical protein [Nitrosarchaeum sp.]